MAKFNIDEVLAAAESGDDMGFCLACGAEAYGVEPDARRYDCDECGKPKVYGAEEILLMMGAWQYVYNLRRSGS